MTVSLVSIYIEYVTIFFFCSPDPATNSETKNLNFPEFFDQLEQILQVLFGYYKDNLIG